MQRPRIAVLTLGVLLTGMLSGIPFYPVRAEPILSSWNPNVSCTPVEVTIEEILGPGRNGNGGATLNGSAWATYDLGYVDANSNNVYDIGETIVNDVNRNLLIDDVHSSTPWKTDKVVSVTPYRSPTQSELGQILRQDKHIKYLDGAASTNFPYNETNSNYDSGETLVYDANLDDAVDVGDTVVSVTPARTPVTAELGETLSAETFGGVFNKRDLNPPCTITNVDGETTSTFVQVNNVQMVSVPPREEILDCTAEFNPINGGGPFPDWDGNGTPDIFCDTTPNLHTAGQPSTCTSTNNLGCPHRIHVEIDHNWKAARYCGASTVCDNSTLHTLTTTTLIDVQGFVFWDPDHTDQGSHGFSGWELHPLTAWRKSPPPPGSFTWSPSTPLPGETITFTGSSFGMTSPTFNWDFGDGQQMVSSGPTTSHAYPRAGAYTVALSVVDISGTTFSRSDTVLVASSLSGSWNPNTLCNAIVVTIEDIRTIPTTNPGVDRRRLAQPCLVTSATEQSFGTLVQINGVKRGTGVSENDYSTTFVAINGGGPYPTGSQADSAFTIYNPAFSFSCTGAGDPNCGHQLFTEIDRDWKAAGYCGPGTVCDNSTLKTQTVTKSTFLDVQAFLFLNAQFANTTFHAFTGWELRITGWRISTLGISADPDALSLMQDTTGSSSIVLAGLNGFGGIVALSASIIPAGPVVTLASTSIELTAGGTNDTTLMIEAGASFPRSYAIAISATGGTATYTASVSLTVTPKPNQLPELTVPTGVQGVDEGEPIIFNVEASDPDLGQNITLSTSALPAGASFVTTVGNPANGVFSWTPDESQGGGQYVIEFTATDSYWGATSKNVTVDVRDINGRPELDAPGNQNVMVNSTLTFVVNASDANVPLNMITLNASGLVSGMSFSATVGNPVVGVFSFTPDVSQAGMTFAVTFTATDDGNPPRSASKTTTIKVNPISDPQLSGLSWTRRLSFSRTNGVQTWTARMSNQNPALGLWVNVQINGLDQSGTVAFSVSSGPVYIPAGQTVSVVLSYAFDHSTVGLTFNFNAEIEWGYSPGNLTFMSPSVRDGSFRIVM